MGGQKNARRISTHASRKSQSPSCERFAIRSRSCQLQMRLMREGAKSSAVAMPTLCKRLYVNGVNIPRAQMSALAPGLPVGTLANLHTLNISHFRYLLHLRCPPHCQSRWVFEAPTDPTLVKHTDHQKSRTKSLVTTLQALQIFDRNKAFNGTLTPQGAFLVRITFVRFRAMLHEVHGVGSIIATMQPFRTSRQSRLKFPRLQRSNPGPFESSKSHPGTRWCRDAARLTPPFPNK